MRFGSREICDVVFRATDKMKFGKYEFQKGQPVFKIDTARTSTLSQETSTVYAQGGRGFARLIAWEGEKTMTFTVEDALMSPMGLKVLTGAGVSTADDEDNIQHFHMTYVAQTNAEGKCEIKLSEVLDELGLAYSDAVDCIKGICIDPATPVYATELDGSGAGIGWFNAVTLETDDKSDYCVPFTSDEPHKEAITAIVGNEEDGEVTLAKDATVELDFYVVFINGATMIRIAPEDFGGYFYVEANTLYRREDTGKDMAAVLTFPKVKIQSAFEIAMSASGDPSTFNFTMDAMPAYTYFNHKKKTMCDIQIIGVDKKGAEKDKQHKVNDTNYLHPVEVEDEELSN